jgi:hypothetical protein
MQLKQRLKRMEAGFDENNSIFCGCFDEFVNQMIKGIYNKMPYETDTSALPKDWCDKCGLPVDSSRIEGIYSSIALIYGKGVEMSG